MQDSRHNAKTKDHDANQLDHQERVDSPVMTRKTAIGERSDWSRSRSRGMSSWMRRSVVSRMSLCVGRCLGSLILGMARWSLVMGLMSRMFCWSLFVGWRMTGLMPMLVMRF
jgi:hypothetical protein